MTMNGYNNINNDENDNVSDEHFSVVVDWIAVLLHQQQQLQQQITAVTF